MAYYRYTSADPYLDALYRGLNTFHSPYLDFEAAINFKDEQEMKAVINTLAEMFISANQEFDRKSFDRAWLEGKGDLLFCGEPARVRIAKLRDICGRFAMDCRDLQYLNITLMELKRKVISLGLHYDMIAKIAANDYIRIQGLMEPFYGAFVIG